MFKISVMHESFLHLPLTAKQILEIARKSRPFKCPWWQLPRDFVQLPNCNSLVRPLIYFGQQPPLINLHQSYDFRFQSEILLYLRRTASVLDGLIQRVGPRFGKNCPEMLEFSPNLYLH